MSSKVKVPRRSSSSLCAFAIIVLCTSVWWGSADSHAQEATPIASRMTADSISWSLEAPGSNAAPHLVISMASPEETAPYGLLRIAKKDEATDPCASMPRCGQTNLAVSGNHAGKVGSGALLLTNLAAPTAGVHGLTNFRANPVLWRQTFQTSADLAGVKGYGLVDDRLVPGPFLYGYQGNYFTSERLLTNSESLAHDLGQAPRPLLQIDLGGWRLPVVLSSARSR
jgi:hypothetical protein